MIHFKTIIHAGGCSITRGMREHFLSGVRRKFSLFGIVLPVFSLMVAGGCRTDAAPVPLAFFDFDGTIIEGDCSEGLVRNGETVYNGTIAAWILSGSCEKYKGQDGVKKFFEKCQEKKNAGRTDLAYREETAVFAGADIKAFQTFCRNHFQELQKYYYVESVRRLRELQAAGVEIHVISASSELVVRSAAETLGIPKENIHGVRLVIKDGKTTDQVMDPLPYGEGKIIIMRQIEKERNGKALYGFGNSYSTDGPFLLEIVKQGGKSVMINGGKTHPGMTEHFQCVTQTQTFASQEKHSDDGNRTGKDKK